MSPPSVAGPAELPSRERRARGDPGAGAGIIQCGAVAPGAGKGMRVQGGAMDGE